MRHPSGMRSTWETVRRSFTRKISAINRDIKNWGLRFSDASVLVAYLTSPTSKPSELDEKDTVYANLIWIAQDNHNDADLATAIIWLGLWPALDGIYRRWLRCYNNPEDLVSELSYMFTTIIHRVNIDAVHRVSATLVRSVERDVRDSRRRVWAEGRRRADLLQEPTSRTRGISELGMPPRLSPDDDAKALHGLLVGIVDEDADLILGATVYGFSQQEVAEMLNISHAAARKRYQRAMKQIRQRLFE